MGVTPEIAREPIEADFREQSNLPWRQPGSCSRKWVECPWLIEDGSQSHTGTCPRPPALTLYKLVIPADGIQASTRFRSYALTNANNVHTSRDIAVQ